MNNTESCLDVMVHDFMFLTLLTALFSHSLFLSLSLTHTDTHCETAAETAVPTLAQEHPLLCAPVVLLGTKGGQASTVRGSGCLTHTHTHTLCHFKKIFFNGPKRPQDKVKTLVVVILSTRGGETQIGREKKTFLNNEEWKKHLINSILSWVCPLLSCFNVFEGFFFFLFSAPHFVCVCVCSCSEGKSEDIFWSSQL